MYTLIDLLAYCLTEDGPPGLDGPSANLALGDLLSNVMQSDGKKDKIGPDGMVSRGGFFLSWKSLGFFFINNH